MKLRYRVEQVNAFGTSPIKVIVQGYSGSGAKALLVGKSADCDARDEKTCEITLEPNIETPVPVLLDPDYDGPEIEIRVSDRSSRVVWTKSKLRNAMLD